MIHVAKKQNKNYRNLLVYCFYQTIQRIIIVKKEGEEKNFCVKIFACFTDPFWYKSSEICEIESKSFNLFL